MLACRDRSEISTFMPSTPTGSRSTQIVRDNVRTFAESRSRGCKSLRTTVDVQRGVPYVLCYAIISFGTPRRAACSTSGFPLHRVGVAKTVANSRRKGRAIDIAINGGCTDCPSSDLGHLPNSEPSPSVSLSTLNDRGRFPVPSPCGGSAPRASILKAALLPNQPDRARPATRPSTRSFPSGQASLGLGIRATAGKTLANAAELGIFGNFTASTRLA